MTSRVQIVAIVGSVRVPAAGAGAGAAAAAGRGILALWIVAALALLAASIRPDIIDRTATWLGIYYGPAVLLLGLVVVVSAVLLWMSVVLSQQQAQIDHLIEETAILGAELRDERLSLESGSIFPRTDNRQLRTALIDGSPVRPAR